MYFHCRIPRFKQCFSFVIPPIGRGNELAALDYLKVCDTTVMLVSAISPEDEIFDRWGKRFINMMAAQGVPTPTFTMMDLQSLAPNRRTTTKAAILKFIQKQFPDEKLSVLDSEADGLNLFRRIGGQKQKTLHNRDKRPHLFAEQWDDTANIASDGDFFTLKVTGYLRGAPLDVNQLIHLPGLGDFQMQRIEW